MVNSLLNYGYGVLYGRVHEAVIVSGLNPSISFLHTEQPGKPTLIFDVIEEFRQPVVDKSVVALIRRGARDLHMEGTGLADSTKKRVVESVLERLCARVRYRSSRVPMREVIRRQARALAECLQSGKSYRPYVDQW